MPHLFVALANFLSGFLSIRDQGFLLAGLFHNPAQAASYRRRTSSS
jgi:hypothetical protein